MPIENRQQILERFPNVGAHAKEHAVQTADLAIKISNLPEYRDLLTGRDRELIEASSLVHDLDYLTHQPYWSTTQWEHPYASLETIDEVFPEFTEVERAIIELVVLNHDATNHSFPALMGESEITRFGFPEVFGNCSRTPGILADFKDVPNEIFEQIPKDKLLAILQIVQEADSRLGDFQRTFDFSINRAIQIAADGGIAGIGMPMWQHSALTNVILAAKRALLDAYTQEGKDYAWRMFEEAREFVKNQIRSLNFLAGENVGEILRRQDVESFIWSHDHFGNRQNPLVRISQAFSLQGAAYVLKSMGFSDLNFDNLTSRLISTDSFDTDLLDSDLKQRLRNNIIMSKDFKFLQSIRGILIRNYALDLLTETSGVLRVMVDRSINDNLVSGEHTLVPPLIENNNTILNPSSKLWISLAKELGFPYIRVLKYDS